MSELREHISKILLSWSIPTRQAAISALMQLIKEEQAKILEEERARTDEYIAYCSCGDSLERTGLYPNETTYYCSGCDKTYKLVEVKHE